jgi:dipeptidyl aminopeptidase/acylaminoacyl peptidase
MVDIKPGITPNLPAVAEVTPTPWCEAVSQSPPDWTPAGNFVGGTAACLYALQNLDMGGESCLSRASFSPDGREVAVKAGDGLYVISTDGTQVRQLMVPPGYSPVMPPGYYGASEMAWSPQGDYIAYVYNDNGVRKVGVSRSRGTSTDGVWVINPQESTAGPRWTTDGQLLVLSETAGSGQVYTVRVGQMPAEIKPVTSCQNYSMSASTGGQQFWPWGPGFTWTANAYDGYGSDGRLFYTYLPDGRQSYLNPDGVNVGGREGTIYSPGGGPDSCGYPAISQVIWSPSGQYLAYEYTCGRGVRIVVHQIGAGSQWTYAAATRPRWLFDPSGDYLLFTSSKGQHFVAWMSGPNDYKEASSAAEELIGPGSNTLYLSASFIEQQQPDWTAKSRSWAIGQAYGD